MTTKKIDNPVKLFNNGTGYGTGFKLKDNTLQVVVDQACQLFYKQLAADADFKYHVVFTLGPHMDVNCPAGIFASVSFTKKKDAKQWCNELLKATSSMAPNGRSIVFAKIEGFAHSYKSKMRYN